MLNLDTHVLVIALSGQLRTAEKRLLRSERWSISAIVLWELAKLAQLGRIEVDLEASPVVRAISAVHVWPITLDVALASTRLDVPGDPADELIAATSVVHRLPLVTRDRNLRRSKQVPLAANGDHIVLRPAPDDPLAAVRGIFASDVRDGSSTDELRADARGEDAEIEERRGPAR